MKTEKTVTVATRIPSHIQATFLKMLKNRVYTNTADYLRDLIRRDLENQVVIIKDIKIDVKETEVEIRENGEVHTVQIMRDADGTIWGMYPQDKNIVFTDGLRNLLILFNKGVLKLEDFPRKPKEKRKT